MPVTAKLYETDPYVQTFTATVLVCIPAGEQFAVQLDRTAFYPEGGGQPCDTGALGTALVTDVQEHGGVITHTVSAALPVGQTVEGRIDWARRRDHMEQHTGEHILSGTLHRLFGAENVGFHIGSPAVRMDMSVPLTAGQLAEAEAQANAVIRADAPVRCWYPAPEDLAKLTYRSKKEIDGDVRIVRIEGVDTCACCGTHVDYTGEIGVIKVLSLMNYKGGVRFSMLCGDRALENFEAKTEQMQTISNLLSAKPEKAAEAVSHLKEESGRKDGEINHLWQRILTMQADVYPQGQKALAVFEQGMTPVLVRQFANLLLEQEKGETVLVCSGDDASGYNYTAGSLGRDMRAFGKELNARLQGRGGGSTQMVQGTFRASREEIEKVFQELARIEA